MGETLSLFSKMQRGALWDLVYPFMPSVQAEHEPPATRVAFRRSTTDVISAGDDADHLRSTRSPLARSYTSAVPTVDKIAEDGSVSPGPGGGSGPNQLELLSIVVKFAKGDGSDPLRVFRDQTNAANKRAIASMVIERIERAEKHVAGLQARVLDPVSRVLVTGDVNAGKSTTVNALLRRDLLPSDQQPCTTVFCEILDANLENLGVQEAHAIRERDLGRYAPTDPTTFDRYALEDLKDIGAVEDDDYAGGDDDKYHLVKVYVADPRAAGDDAHRDSPLINNGLVAISLIDAPGLNVDTLKTTGVFARQSEIDVIVFVVNAENHFTLSAKEFLLNASHEKAYVFVVVNKIAGIRDKERCRRLVGDQIRRLSPKTWEGRGELVHFVDSLDIVSHFEGAGPTAPASIVNAPPAFEHLERCLRQFVLRKRLMSKLAPAQTYLLKLYADIALLAEVNRKDADESVRKATAELDQLQPTHRSLLRDADAVHESVSSVEDERVTQCRAETRERLEAGLRDLSRGRLAGTTPPNAKPTPTFAGVAPFSAPTRLPPYPGLFGMWAWAQDVRICFERSLEGVIRIAEEHARAATDLGVHAVRNDVADRFLAYTGGEKMPPPPAFKPEAMFVKRRNAYMRALRTNGVMTSHVGIGLQSPRAALELSVFDLLDMDKWMHWTATDERLAQVAGDEATTEAAGAVTVAGIGLGSVMLYGSHAIGFSRFFDSVTRATDILSSPALRRWLGPAAAAAGTSSMRSDITDPRSPRPRSVRDHRSAANAAAQHRPQARHRPRRPVRLDGRRHALRQPRRAGSRSHLRRRAQGAPPCRLRSARAAPPTARGRRGEGAHGREQARGGGDGARCAR